MANSDNIITMDIAFHPGETLQEKLKEMNVSVHDFGEMTKVPENIIQDIIDGDTSVSSEIAIAFEQATQIPAKMWIHLQHSYDDYFLAKKSSTYMDRLLRLARNKVAILSTLPLLLLAVGCQKDEEGITNPEQPQYAISFNSELNDEGAATRTTVPLYSFHKNFKVNGVKIKNSAEEKVCSSYRVQYIDADKYWDYIAGRHTDIPSTQIEKYWDYDATEYHFIAGAPFAQTTVSSSDSLSINGLENTSVNSESSTIKTGYLFAEPKTVVKADYNNKVMMTFRLAMSRIKFAFYLSEASDENVALSNITFAPTSGKYVSKGDLRVKYDFSTATPTYKWYVNATTSLSTAWTLQNVTLAIPGTEQTFCSSIYYVIPVASAATSVPWTLTVGSLEDNKTATVPAAYTKWEPGKQYVYVFKISNAQSDPTIKFITCVQTAITDWDTGETSNSEVYNW